MGLRERKKEQTRARLIETAWQLAVDSGYDQVTVADIARSAEVSQATLFNYFRTKEDLFYAPLEAFGGHLVEAVRTRRAGTTPLDAVRDFLLQSHGILGPLEPNDNEADKRMRGTLQVINDSPALLDREQRAFAQYAEDLAALLDEETGRSDTVAAAVAAHALMGVHRSLVAYVRQRVLAGESLHEIADDVRRYSDRSFSLLETGLEQYAIKK